MKYAFLILPLAVLFAFNAPARAEETSVQAATVQNNEESVTDVAVVGTAAINCNTDIAQHCADPSLNEGNKRIECLMAHEADLEPACKQGILGAAIQTKLGVAALDVAYESCKTERADLCGNVEAGEGRILACLKENEAKVTPDCMTALKATGIWDAEVEAAPAQ